MKKEKKGILKGSIVLGAGAFFAKLLGAIYRIPLTALIGGAGLGLYQMIFPVYTVLLDFSGAGVPNALSKLVAENSEHEGYGFFITAVRFFAIVGLIGSLLMVFFAKPFSILQGNKDAFLGYITLAPAVFFVSLISCYRGFFQGKMNMFPTATSQIIEQIVKLCLGLVLVYVFVPDIKMAVAGATLAISVSELIAFIQLYVSLKRKKNTYFLGQSLKNIQFKQKLKQIISYAVPITLIGIILPTSQIIDSFLALNILGKYSLEATALYGLLSGVAMTIINLPVSICYGISSVAVPFVSSAKTEDRQDKAKKSMLLTFVVALPCTLICYFFSPLIVKILFRSLSNREYLIAVKLLKILSPTILALSLVQTQNAVFIGMGKKYVPIVTMFIGVTIKIIIESVLYKNQNFNIYGGALAIIACYFFICLINLMVMTFIGELNASKTAISSKLTT